MAEMSKLPAAQTAGFFLSLQKNIVTHPYCADDVAYILYAPLPYHTFVVIATDV